MSSKSALAEEIQKRHSVERTLMVILDTPLFACFMILLTPATFLIQLLFIKKPLTKNGQGLVLCFTSVKKRLATPLP